MDPDQFKFRMPQRIRRQVIAEAKKNGRTISGELNHLIETGLANPGDVSLLTRVATEAAEQAAARMAPAQDELVAKIVKAMTSELSFQTAMLFKMLSAQGAAQAHRPGGESQ
jgi:hypothetical protein